MELKKAMDLNKWQATTLVDCRAPTEGARHRHTVMTSVVLQQQESKLGST
jgi:hypothetical protein